MDGKKTSIMTTHVGKIVFLYTLLYAAFLIWAFVPWKWYVVPRTFCLGDGYRYVYSGKTSRTLIFPDGKRVLLDDMDGPDFHPSVRVCVKNNKVIFEIVEIGDDDGRGKYLTRNYFFVVDKVTRHVYGPLNATRCSNLIKMKVSHMPWTDIQSIESLPHERQSRTSGIISHLFFSVLGEYPILFLVPLLPIPMYFLFILSKKIAKDGPIIFSRENVGNDHQK